MGIKTKLSLQEAQALFPQAHFTALLPTSDGVIDTSYIAISKEKRLILKKYEQAGKAQIEDEAKLLDLLHQHHLHVPKLLYRQKEWFVYSFIEGESFKRPCTRHLKDLGRFMGNFHRATHKKKSRFTPFTQKSLSQDLLPVRKNYPHLSRKIKNVSARTFSLDGIIHGDLFTDNAKHDTFKLGVFDFIESGNGDFALDLGIAASSWALLDQGANLSRFNLLLRSYNQVAKKKVSAQAYLDAIETGLLIYMGKRLRARMADKESTLRYQTLYQRYRRFDTSRKKMKNVLYPRRKV